LEESSRRFEGGAEREGEMEERETNNSNYTALATPQNVV
jgi:hypothetical protein